MNIFLNSAGLQEGTDCVSKAVALGDFVYVSLQMGSGDTIHEQVITALNKVVDALATFELELYHVAKFTIYVTDIQEKNAILSVYKNFVEAPFPALSIVGVNELEKGAHVGIEAYALNTLRYERASQESSCGHDCDSCQGCGH